MQTRRNFLKSTSLGISSLATIPLIDFDFNPYPKMDVPNRSRVFKPEFGRKLIKLLGGDPSKIGNGWWWNDFFRNYKHLKNEFELFFTKNPCGVAAYYMDYCGSDREWRERIIERAKDGCSASLMVHYGSNRQWAEKIIEFQNDVIRAKWMVKNYGSSKEWYKKVTGLEFV